MNQDERQEYLINELSAGGDREQQVFMQWGDKRRVLRALMNVRNPAPLSDEFLQVQDLFLQEESRQKKAVTLEDIPTVREAYQSHHEMGDRISIWHGDITRLQIGAIVNAANSQLLGCFLPCHGCIDNAIHSAAGLELRQACYQYMREKRSRYGQAYTEPTGSAVVTPGFNLPCDYVIHTVGPIVGTQLTDSLRADLRSCYASCMKAAAEHQIRSIAFCCISTGEFHFPNDEAAEIAVDTVTNYLEQHSGDFDRVIFNVFKDSDQEIYEAVLR